MSNKPKQWGGVSPEGLGKLRTAVATLLGQNYVHVSGPGFEGKRAGGYQSVTVYGSKEDKAAIFFVTMSKSGKGKCSGSLFSAFERTVAKIRCSVSYRFGCYIDLKIPPPAYSGPSYQYEFLNDGFVFTGAYVKEYGASFSLKLSDKTSGAKRSIVEKQDGAEYFTSLCSAWDESACFEGATFRENCNQVFDYPLSLGARHSDDILGAMYLYTRGDDFSSPWGFPLTTVKYAVSLRRDGEWEIKEGSLPNPLPGAPFGPGLVIVASCSTGPGSAALVVRSRPVDLREPTGDVVWEDERLYAATGPQGGYIITSRIYENTAPAVWLYKTEDFGESWVFSRVDCFDIEVEATELGVPIPNTLLTTPCYQTISEPREDFECVGTGFRPQITGGNRWELNRTSLIDYLGFPNNEPFVSSMVCPKPGVLVLVTRLFDFKYYGAWYNAKRLQSRMLMARSVDYGGSWEFISAPYFSDPTQAPTDADFLMSGNGPFHLRLSDVGGGSIIFIGGYREGNENIPLDKPENCDKLFLRSDDCGATWEQFQPSGLPYRHMGGKGVITSAPPSAEDSPARLLTSAWDGSAWRVYFSDDKGFTWERGAAIGKDFDDPPTEIVYMPPRRSIPVCPASPWKYDDRFQNI